MNKLISSTFHGCPSTCRRAFSCPTNGSGSGKTERGAVYMSPCVLCYSKSRNNIVQACPRAPHPPASWEGHDAHVRCYWVQFGNNSNAVADNRGLWRGSSVEKQKQSSRISATVVSKQVVRHQSATCDGRRVCLPSRPHSRLARLVVGPFWAWIWTGGGPSVHWKTGRVSEISWTGSS